MAWEAAFGEILGVSELSTKMCADLAVGFVSDLYGKLFAQVDPVRLGAVMRANTIATRYGTELAEKRKNLKTDAIRQLVLNYPAHSYSIDLDEGRKLFNKVRAPNARELKLIEAFENQILRLQRSEKDRIIHRLDMLLKSTQNEDGDVEANEDSNSGNNDNPETGTEPTKGGTDANQERQKTPRGDASPAAGRRRDDARGGGGESPDKPGNAGAPAPGESGAK
jgi:hypothetical protein